MSDHAPGTHLLIDHWGGRHLDDPDVLEAALRRAAKAAGAQVLAARFHRFGGHAGVTGVLLLAESHITVHTWPEQGYAALDVFLCGAADARAAAAELEAVLAPAEARITAVPRGQRNQASQPSS